MMPAPSATSSTLTLAPSTSPALLSATVAPTTVSVAWADGRQSEFHHMWLRDNCACEQCGPHASGARLQRLLDIPADIYADRASIEDDELRVRWANDDHLSRFSSVWLRRHDYTIPVSAGDKPLPKTLWGGDLQRWPAVEWDRVLVDDVERWKLHASVAELGFVLVHGLGTDHDAIEVLAREVGYIRETHYGRIFDLITRRTPIILADLAGPMLPHTDEAYRNTPTGINIFHCIQPSADGGGQSQLVDAHRVAATLKEQNPAAFALLTRVPVRHERRIDTQLITSSLPAIVVDHDGEVTEVRLNERTMSAIQVAPGDMDEVYRAVREAFTIAYDPACRISCSLQAGDALLFDNLRVLHGRTGYGGYRFLRQTQVMRDEFYGMGAALSEAVGESGSVLDLDLGTH